MRPYLATANQIFSPLLAFIVIIEFMIIANVFEFDFHH
jgi:hypothetical protein